MKPGRFRYYEPAVLSEAASLAAEHAEDAALLAGGQSLVPMMNLRIAQVPVLIDLNRIAELDYIRRQNGHLAIGAMTRQRSVERSAEVAANAPLVAEAMPQIAYPAIRNRGTIGGSIAHADPAAELPCALLASDATVVLRSLRGTRDLDIAALIEGPFMTRRAADELLEEVRIPAIPARTATAFEEFARKAGDFALVTAAVALTLDDQGRATRVRIAVGGAGPVPARAAEAERLLLGQAPTAEACGEAARAAADELEVIGDSHGSAEYRRRLIVVQTRRALERAAGRAPAGPSRMPEP